jgi:hypothetical protein
MYRAAASYSEIGKTSGVPQMEQNFDCSIFFFGWNIETTHLFGNLAVREYLRSYGTPDLEPYNTHSYVPDGAT